MLDKANLAVSFCNLQLLIFRKNNYPMVLFISRYLYKLCDLHLSVENFTEAAFTLLLHAELLAVSNISFLFQLNHCLYYSYNILQQQLQWVQIESVESYFLSILKLELRSKLELTSSRFCFSKHWKILIINIFKEKLIQLIEGFIQG